ncbi:MAG: DUF3501 family protein [Pseudomonadota bacterium]
MPAPDRRITPEDIIPCERYAAERAARRRALLPLKALRRVEVGPFATFHFENFATMLAQVQEMLHIEKGGAAQLAGELAAYNPLIPQGTELVATCMLEIDDPARRDAVLRRLGGIDEHAFLQIGAEKIYASAEKDVERTAEDGKTSAVHFLRFALTPAAMTIFKREDIAVLLGFDHPHYAHLAILSPATRAELAKDFA